MPITVHAAVIPSFLQTIGVTAALVDKAEAFSVERSIAPAELLEARLAEDMLPFAYQVKSVAVHSFGAIEGIRRGEFSPDRSEPGTSFAALRERLAAAKAGLDAVTIDEMESFVGRDMAFVFGDRRLPFAAEDFLLSFSQPNFYFHATTAYDILRARGIAVGKRDFLGQMRIRR